MKIIGKANEKFLVEISEDEIFNILGYSGRFDSDKPKNMKTFSAGDVIKVSEIFDQLKYFKYNENRLKDISDELIRYASNLTLIDRVVKVNITEEV